MDPAGSFRRHRGRAVLVMLTLLALMAIFLAFRNLGQSAASGRALRPLSETPGSAKAILYSTDAARSADLDFINSQLTLQHYSVRELTVDNGQATAANFKDALTSSRGVLFVAGVGGPDFLGVEMLADAGTCATALSRYLTGGTFTTGEIICHQGILGITGMGIGNLFRDTETIVYVSACDSTSMESSFTNSRDFVGYQDCAGHSLMARGDRLFWSRMAGTEDGGRSRSTMVAAGAGGYGGQWHFIHRPNTLDTVLSPSVAQASPAPADLIPVAEATMGRVVFDTRMDRSVPAAAVISVTGCGAVVANSKWATAAGGYDEIEFQVMVAAPGTAVFTVHAAFARAGRVFQNVLDGNQVPSGSDGVGPNGDDFIWTVGCVVGTGPVLPATVPLTTVPVITVPVLPPAGTTTTVAPASGSGPTGPARSGGGGTPRTTVAPTGSTSGPTCAVSAFRNSPAPARQYATVQASAGLASITGATATNGTVTVGGFAVGTKGPVTVFATKTDQTKPTEWSFDATDLDGRTTFCH